VDGLSYGNSSAICSIAAGGACTPPALFYNPDGIAVSSSGMLFVVDGGNNAIRTVQQLNLPTSTPAPTSCSSSNFTLSPRMDLMGSFLSVSQQLSSASCQTVCCGVLSCQGYAFSQASLDVGGSTGSCYLYANITYLVPNSGFSSGLLS